jgi:hypothetical protein
VAYLHDIATLRVPTAAIDETWRVLRWYGRSGNEGFVLWLGRIDGGVGSVCEALVPPQESVQGKDGVGYFVTSETLFEVNRALHRSGLRLLAQVHSHQTHAYHSSTDDAYAVVTTEGDFSLVVPDFARAAPHPQACAVCRLLQGRWIRLSGAHVASVCDWGQ